MLIRKRGNIASVAREEGYGDSAVMSLHRLMFVFARIKAGT
jgi:hypothetical protein